VSADTRAWVIRRILVALDASRHSVAALQVAADLASHLEAELVGLFVEDINLLRLAELPFAREVGSYSGTRRRLNTRQVERQLKVQAERARRALEAYADRASVRWSFEVTRGVVAPCVLAAASDADLVILGRASHGARTTGGLGSTARRVLVKPSANALASVIGREGCGTLVLPAKCALLDRDAVVALLDTLDLPALLIR